MNEAELLESLEHVERTTIRIASTGATVCIGDVRGMRRPARAWIVVSAADPWAASGTAWVGFSVADKWQQYLPLFEQAISTVKVLPKELQGSIVDDEQAEDDRLRDVTQ